MTPYYLPYMRFLSKAEPLANALHKVCKWLSLIGMLFFTVMVSITFLDVFLRYVFNSPLAGTYEITAILMAVVVFSSIGYAQWGKNHVVMDVITGSLEPENRDTLACATLLWSIAVCVLCVWTSSRFALQTKGVTAQLALSLKPAIWFAVFGFVTLLLSLFWDFLCAVARVLALSRTRVAVSILLGVLPILAACWLSSNIVRSSPVLIGCIGIVVLFVLFLAGMPVAFALMATGFVFAGTIRGLTPALGFYGKLMFNTSANYVWSPLMFFMLMGYFCFYGDLGRDLYTCAKRWLGHLRGGLAQGSVCACAAFGAVVGDNLSGSIAMSAIALPEMRKNGYDDKLSVGTLACSGTIGPLIPPSADFILYAVLAEQSVADLFMAGAIPGIICTVLFCIAVWLMVWKNPSLAPRLPKENAGVRIKALMAALPILVLFVLVIGGIYSGMFTPTEGGAIGATGAFLCALLMGRMNLKRFAASLNDAGKYITMSFTVLTGAAVFGYFMALSRIPQTLAGSISTMGLPPGVTMLAIILIMFVLGSFVPSMPLLLVCVPTFLPIVALFQWDPIWFGVIIVILINQATISPPFGINLFVIKEVAGISLKTMFVASLPFVAAMFILLALVYFVPATATWLPSVMR